MKTPERGWRAWRDAPDPVEVSHSWVLTVAQKTQPSCALP